MFRLITFTKETNDSKDLCARISLGEGGRGAWFFLFFFFLSFFRFLIFQLSALNLKQAAAAPILNYRNLHLRFLVGSGGSRAANMASSKTFFSPFCECEMTWNAFEKQIDTKHWDCLLEFTCVKAEHSTYLTAFSSLANFSPCSIVMGFCLFFASFSNVVFSSRKSICVPTNKNGVFWQWCVISGTHYAPQVNGIENHKNQSMLLYGQWCSRIAIEQKNDKPFL